MLQKCSFILIYFSLAVSYGQGQKEIPLDSSLWAIQKNTKAVFETIHNRKTVFLDGRAILKDFSFSNGTLEVDIWANSSRSFAGIFFRSQNETFEEVYLRMHKSNQLDAVQYTPIFKGESNWQLYQEHQVKVLFKEKGWNTLKISIVNNTAKIFVNNEPVMEIAHLKIGSTIGSVGLWALFGNRFSNFRYTEGTTFTPEFKHPKKLNPNILSNWEISNPHSYSATQFKKDFTAKIYKKVVTESSGLLPISKYIKKSSKGNFDKNEEDYVILKLKIRSEKDQSKLFFFDYSDKAIVFLNQIELFKGNNAFRSKGNQFKGHMNVDSNAINLALKKGMNTLHIVVIEKANGWGFVGKIENKDGISLE